ncbi:FAD-binding oxidoreductase [Egicoccus sp. AB-alg2]|uniref:FAD-binding oxidoreductase n=1 Tax=Egicoccus sp. AB-alg2 TaxID=3242693 RepID=UPI00359EBB4A
MVAALGFAREHALEVAVRSGGHSFPGLSVVDDGLVVDLGPMKAIEVDPRAGRVRVQAGVLLGELDRATQAYDSAVPTGAVTHTGVAGLTLGGGIRWLMRRHGLSVDQLWRVSLVTADGRRVVADDRHHPELFWGVRGGGGNFGVVTKFTFDLHPVGPGVLSGLVLWPFEQADEVTRVYRDWCRDAPRELTTALLLRRAPAVDLIPEDLHGRLVVGVMCCWSGPLARGELVLAPMRRLGDPVIDLTDVRPFVEHQSMLDASYPHGIWVHLRACDVGVLDDEVLDVTLEHAARMLSPRSSVVVWQLGGAVAEVDAAATAFGGRASGHVFNVSGITADAEGFEQERAWVREFGKALQPHATGVYVNFLMEEGADRVEDAYGRERYRRLQAVKRAYDPDNVFHRNQNIAP